ncbi:DUF3024 domain-containing protein [Marinomonas transparens]|uniref:DUF3024 domain-containing protein n=1 Tax=Marinomonas transparens TaxID=2795388 RepID=A0A934N260_9GAMM|nr:DUF3024 domain-containing protein [Marinomonas transparens]MBJ7537458.1 DUF3024 domain-containing protein [Marinomonas transparens]
MAISEFEVKRCEREMDKFLSAHRPPAHIRQEVDLAYRLDNQSVEIFEIRPDWKDSTEKIEIPIAKATYVKAKKEWKVYWQKSDMKWHRYEPCPTVKYLEEFLSVVGEDSFSCFFG